MKVQRLRLTFSRDEEVKYISHLDLMRLWVRAFRRSGLPLAYSEGFSPHPRIALAAPLPVGVVSTGELLDVFFTRRVAPYYVLTGLASQLPKGIELTAVEEVALTLPSLQSQVRAAEYQVMVETTLPAAEGEAALSGVLAQKEVPWEHLRDGQMRRYDLRELVEQLRLESWRDGEATLFMKLRIDEAGSGRPEQVAAALGFTRPPVGIHRRKILLVSADASARPRGRAAVPSNGGR